MAERLASTRNTCTCPWNGSPGPGLCDVGLGDAAVLGLCDVGLGDSVLLRLCDAGPGSAGLLVCGAAPGPVPEVDQRNPIGC